MTDANSGVTNGTPTAMDNFVQPFFLSSGLSRGVLVRGGRVVQDTMGAHDYPASVAKLLAESHVLGVALASTLKYDGLFTLQIRGDGPVRALVIDVTSAGMTRGVARFDAERVASLSGASLNDLTGQGVLTFTVDQGPDTEPYQGIVGLEGDTVTECALRYIDQSEQIPTLLLIATRPPETEGDTWHAGALLVQRMPRPDSLSEPEADESWATTSALMKTLGPDELLDPGLSAGTLLWRLFHEENVHLADPRPIFYGCRCSPEKVVRTLATLPPDDLQSLGEKGVIDVVCDFCQTNHAITPDQVKAYRQSLTDLNQGND